MASASSSAGPSHNSLNKLFRKCLVKVLALDHTNVESSSAEYQKLLKELITRLEKSTEMVNGLQLFSSNEELEDIQTSYLKYLLIPAFLGYLTSRLTGKDRKEILNMSLVYFCDFLQRLYDYKILKEEPPKISDEEEKPDNNKLPNQPSLKDMADRRSEKITIFNELRTLNNDLEKMSYIVKRDKEESDSETTREYYLKLIRRWIFVAKDEIKLMKMELNMLNMFSDTTDANPPKPKVSSFKPFIITKNELQKKVYGLGYPSRPTVTIEEFMNTKIDEGSLSVAQGHSLEKWANDPDYKKVSDEQDDAQKDALVDKDDEVNLIRERNWDDWKDEHRPGWGNRQNMG